MTESTKFAPGIPAYVFILIFPERVEAQETLSGHGMVLVGYLLVYREADTFELVMLFAFLASSIKLSLA